MRILIIEDSIPLADTLTEALEKEHFIVDVAHDGKSGYEYAASDIYDIIILDLMIPIIDGYELLRRLRRDKHDVSVLILSAKSEIEDKIQGFEAGTDDYMTKPFDMRELIMRIHAIVNRRGGQNIVVYQIGNLYLDMGTCELTNTKTGKKMQIMGKELQLMELFLRNKYQVLEKEQIATKIWGYDSDAEYNKVEVYVSFLRRKLNHLHTNVRIRSVRGVGYILEICDD